jgi:aldose 1-epimerase
MRARLYIAIICAGLILSGSCKRNETETDQSNLKADTMAAITKKSFGTTPEGKEVTEFTLTNKRGVSLSVINYGGIITRLLVPNRKGVLEDIVLGYDSLSGYVKDSPYFGAIVGRYGNRIANGKFTLDGKEYTLAQNNNGQHLHGGVKGFDKVFWNVEEAGANTLRLTYQSKDMEEGYPGNLSVEVTYALTDVNELKISYTATTDKKTIINLTQHSYFNLTGNAKRDILDHELTLYSDKFVPVTKVLIPTGELKDVSGSPFDFRTSTAIGARVNEKDQQLGFGRGYDHCWVLSSPDSMKHAASLYEPVSGRALDVYTTEPAIQFYCGNFLDGSITGKYNVVYSHRYGLCLETEHYPDSPNQKDFPSTELSPGEVYQTQTTYKFSTR